jgi:NDP-sugar pyrophosphorylase family protein
LKAVILAGGRGSRFGEATLHTPKPLITVAGKPLIRHVLDALPVEITECIIVIGYLGASIQNALGEAYESIQLQYVYQNEIGTGGALLSAGPLLSLTDRFLVIGSDDIFGPGELSKLLRVKSRHVWGLYHGIPEKQSAWNIVFDENHILRGHATTARPFEPRYIGTGAYALSHEFLSAISVRLPNGEFSIPHSLMRSVEVGVVMIDKWLQVNDPAQKKVAEQVISSRS